MIVVEVLTDEIEITNCHVLKISEELFHVLRGFINQDFENTGVLAIPFGRLHMRYLSDLNTNNNCN